MSLYDIAKNFERVPFNQGADRYVEALPRFPYIRFTNPIGITDELDQLRDGGGGALPIWISNSEIKLTSIAGGGNTDEILVISANGVIKRIPQPDFDNYVASNQNNGKGSLKVQGANGLTASLQAIVDSNDIPQVSPISISLNAVQFNGIVSMTSIASGASSDDIVVRNATTGELKKIAQPNFSNFITYTEGKGILRVGNVNGLTSSLQTVVDGNIQSSPIAISLSAVSISGLISFTGTTSGSNTDELLVRNPTTGEVKRIPQPNFDSFITSNQANGKGALKVQGANGLTASLQPIVDSNSPATASPIQLSTTAVLIGGIVSMTDLPAAAGTGEQAVVINTATGQLKKSAGTFVQESLTATTFTPQYRNPTTNAVTATGTAIGGQYLQSGRFKALYFSSGINSAAPAGGNSSDYFVLINNQASLPAGQRGPIQTIYYDQNGGLNNLVNIEAQMVENVIYFFLNTTTTINLTTYTQRTYLTKALLAQLPSIYSDFLYQFIK